MITAPERKRKKNEHKKSKRLIQKSNKTIISFEYPQKFEPGKNERYYPISNPETKELYDKYKQLAEKIEGLYFIGRLGTYKYYNMDKAAENVFELFKTLQG